MKTRIRHFPFVSAIAWANHTAKDIPEHWSVEKFEDRQGWFPRSKHPTLSAAKNAEAALYLPRQFGGEA